MKGKTFRGILILAACWLGASVPLGCDSGPVYSDSDTNRMIGSVPPRARWRASGTVADAPNAIDGNINTIAVGTESGGRMSFVLDLGKPAVFNMIAVDHGRNEFGFAKQVEVYTSLDGRRFERQHTALGTRRVSTFLLITPVLARYIRLDATVPGDRPWSLAEIHVQ